MHSAFSVIFFNAASGAGYGLLALLGIFNALGLLPTDPMFGLTSLGLALGLISLGLLSSTLHLGHPERAIGVLTQWRSSWLSREGVAAILTYLPAGIFGIGWVFLGRTDGPFLVAGLVTAGMAGLTVFCTAMIYSSLKAVRTWNHGIVVANYLSLSLMSGAVFLVLLLMAYDPDAFPEKALWTAGITILTAWILKTMYWGHVNGNCNTVTSGSATGLAHLGPVRLIDPPHSQSGFLLKEMGHQLTPYQTSSKRFFAALFAFFLPLVATVLQLAPPRIDIVNQHPLASLLLAVTAAIFVSLGLLLERWIFFAEAKLRVMLYHGEVSA